ENVPPTTFEAIYGIIEDIMNNSNQGLLSSGVVLAVFLMANGVNAMLAGFENSYHVTITRNFIKQYLVSFVLGIWLSVILIISVAVIIISEVLLNAIEYWYVDRLVVIDISRYVLVLLMIWFCVSLLFKYGSKQLQKTSLVSIGSIITTVLIALSSYGFRSEEHTSELQSRENLVCRLLLEKKKSKITII